MKDRYVNIIANIKISLLGALKTKSIASIGIRGTLPEMPLQHR